MKTTSTKNQNEYDLKNEDDLKKKMKTTLKKMEKKMAVT